MPVGVNADRLCLAMTGMHQVFIGDSPGTTGPANRPAVGRH
jgi:hypothetical protein